MESLGRWWHQPRRRKSEGLLVYFKLMISKTRVHSPKEIRAWYHDAFACLCRIRYGLGGRICHGNTEISSNQNRSNCSIVRWFIFSLVVSVYLKNEYKSRLYTLEYTARLRSSVELTSLYTLKLQSTQSIISLFPWNYGIINLWHVFMFLELLMGQLIERLVRHSSLASCHFSVWPRSCAQRGNLGAWHRVKDII